MPTDPANDGTTHAEGCHTWGRQHYECAVREVERLRDENVAIRELMNVYNLGGWTDAIAPMKRALVAERERDELRRRISEADEAAA